MMAWLTWRKADYDPFPTAQLLNRLDEWGDRCPLCYLRRRSRLRGSGHAIEQCKTDGADRIRHFRAEFVSRLRQIQSNKAMLWCLRCCLPVDLHQPGGNWHRVCYAGTFGPNCKFFEVIVDALAVMLFDSYNDFFSTIISDWMDESFYLEGTNEWLSTATTWGDKTVPTMTKVFNQLAEFARRYKEW